eukprot:TRINITY_DN68167_c0_g1_i1.p1 TRINITY_DN68167_c0_g1~~TRINITY_DN68167_c0_g1_i1.p1  ORF type:complete len:116 (+),score=6.67 TRINITY_DN68167_c0_g1_i1:46-393(+)
MLECLLGSSMHVGMVSLQCLGLAQGLCRHSVQTISAKMGYGGGDGRGHSSANKSDSKRGTDGGKKMGSENSSAGTHTLYTVGPQHKDVPPPSRACRNPKCGTPGSGRCGFCGTAA